MRTAGESGGKAMSRIYSNIGFRGLWNGLPVRIGMIGTLTAFQWLIYDSFKASIPSGFLADRDANSTTGIPWSADDRRPLRNYWSNSSRQAALILRNTIM